MFAYCNNDPVDCTDSTGLTLRNQFEDYIRSGNNALIVNIGVVTVGSSILILAVESAKCIYTAICETTTAVLDFGRSLFQSKEKEEEKEKDITAEPPANNGTTYYHVTTLENAEAIIASGLMTGSAWEGGYVYAWKTNPSKYAIENSGAHMGVTISFKTTASFVMDSGITDPKVLAYGPVVSTIPGPIAVWDVKIVG